jgi:hypothetical protein
MKETPNTAKPKSPDFYQMFLISTKKTTLGYGFKNPEKSLA